MVLCVQVMTEFRDSAVHCTTKWRSVFPWKCLALNKEDVAVSLVWQRWVCGQTRGLAGWRFLKQFGASAGYITILPISIASLRKVSSKRQDTVDAVPVSFRCRTDKIMSTAKRLQTICLLWNRVSLRLSDFISSTVATHRNIIPKIRRCSLTFMEMVRDWVKLTINCLTTGKTAALEHFDSVQNMLSHRLKCPVDGPREQNCACFLWIDWLRINSCSVPRRASI